MAYWANDQPDPLLAGCVLVFMHMGTQWASPIA